MLRFLLFSIYDSDIMSSRRETLRVLALGVVSGLAGCGSTDDAPPEKNEESTSTQTEVETTTDTGSSNETPAEVRVEISPDRYPRETPIPVRMNLINRGEKPVEFSATVLLNDDVVDTISGELAANLEKGYRKEYRFDIDVEGRDSAELRIKSDSRTVPEKSHEIELVQPRHTWREYGATSKNSFANTRTWGPSERVTQQWVFEQSTYGQPAVADGKLFICSDQDGTSLVSISMETGQKLWEVETDAVFEGAVVRGNTVYLTEVGGEGRTRAITTDGTELWEFDHSTHSKVNRRSVALTYHVPVVRDDKVFVHSPEEGVFALDRQTGDVLWNAGGITAICSLAADGEKVYGAGTVDSGDDQASGAEQRVWSIEQETGDVVWTAGTNVTLDPDLYVGPRDEKYDPGFRFTPPTIADGNVYIGTSHLARLYQRKGGPIDDGKNNHLLVLDKDSGELKNTFGISHYTNSPAPSLTAHIRVGVELPLTLLDFDIRLLLCKPATSDRLYLISPDDSLSARPDLTDRSGLFSFGLDIPTDAPAVATVNGLYFVSARNDLLRINLRARLKSQQAYKLGKNVVDIDEDVLESHRGLAVFDSTVVMSGKKGVRVLSDN